MEYFDEIETMEKIESKSSLIVALDNFCCDLSALKIYIVDSDQEVKNNIIKSKGCVSEIWERLENCATLSEQIGRFLIDSENLKPYERHTKRYLSCYKDSLLIADTLRECEVLRPKLKRKTIHGRLTETYSSLGWKAQSDALWIGKWMCKLASEYPELKGLLSPKKSQAENLKEHPPILSPKRPYTKEQLIYIFEELQAKSYISCDSRQEDWLFLFKGGVKPADFSPIEWTARKQNNGKTQPNKISLVYLLLLMTVPHTTAKFMKQCFVVKDAAPWQGWDWSEKYKLKNIKMADTHKQQLHEITNMASKLVK